MRLIAILSLSLLAGCGPSITETQAVKRVEEAEAKYADLENQHERLLAAHRESGDADVADELLRLRHENDALGTGLQNILVELTFRDMGNEVLRAELGEFHAAREATPEELQAARRALLAEMDVFRIYHKRFLRIAAEEVNKTKQHRLAESMQKLLGTDVDKDSAGVEAPRTEIEGADAAHVGAGRTEYPIVIEHRLYGGVELEARFLRAAAAMEDDLDAVKVYDWACDIWRMLMDGEEPSRWQLYNPLRTHEVRFNYDLTPDAERVQLIIARKPSEID